MRKAIPKSDFYALFAGGILCVVGAYGMSQIDAAGNWQRGDLQVLTSLLCFIIGIGMIRSAKLSRMKDDIAELGQRIEELEAKEKNTTKL